MRYEDLFYKKIAIFQVYIPRETVEWQYNSTGLEIWDVSV